MSIRLNDIEILPGAPFANCKLNRKQYAVILTDIITSYADGFVLAINNEWGTGKTTFVKMWEQYLKDKQFKTLYFNAWENDFQNDPLVAIMAELSTLKNSKTEKRFKSLLEKGAKISKAILPGLVMAFAKKHIDSKTLVDALEEASKEAGEIFSKEVEEYVNKKKGLVEFKQELENYISEVNNERPLVFIIDELDRCRPDYAVAVLEKIKHFFSVKGIVFVLSIDKVQLGHAIKGFYGSDKMDSAEYLRRFIDIEYSIPNPDTKEFCNYLYDQFNFKEFFQSEERNKHTVFNTDSDDFKDIAARIFENANLTLRQQEKIFTHSRIVLKSFSPNQFVIPILFLFLVFIRTIHKEFFIQIQSKKLSLEDLLDKVKEVIIMGDDYDGLFINRYVYLEALLLLFYNNHLGKQRKRLIEKDDENNIQKVVVSSRFDKSEDSNLLSRNIIALDFDRNLSGIPITFLLRKLNLADVIVK